MTSEYTRRTGYPAPEPGPEGQYAAGNDSHGEAAALTGDGSWRDDYSTARHSGGAAPVPGPRSAGPQDSDFRLPGYSHRHADNDVPGSYAAGDYPAGDYRSPGTGESDNGTSSRTDSYGSGTYRQAGTTDGGYGAAGYGSGGYAAGDYPTGAYPAAGGAPTSAPGSALSSAPGSDPSSGYPTGGYPAAGHPTGDYPTGGYRAGSNAAGGYGSRDSADSGYGAAPGYEPAGSADTGYGMSRYEPGVPGEAGYGSGGYGSAGSADSGYGSGHYEPTGSADSGYGSGGYGSAGSADSGYGSGHYEPTGSADSGYGSGRYESAGTAGADYQASGYDGYESGGSAVTGYGSSRYEPGLSGEAGYGARSQGTAGSSDASYGSSAYGSAGPADTGYRGRDAGLAEGYGSAGAADTGYRGRDAGHADGYGSTGSASGTSYQAAGYGDDQYRSGGADAGYATSGYAGPGYPSGAADPVPGYSDAGGTHAGASDYAPSEVSADYRTADYRSGDHRTGDHRTGDHRTGDYGTADYGTADYGTASYGAREYGTGEYRTAGHGTSERLDGGRDQSGYPSSTGSGHYARDDYQAGDYRTDAHQPAGYLQGHAVPDPASPGAGDGYPPVIAPADYGSQDGRYQPPRVPEAGVTGHGWQGDEPEALAGPGQHPGHDHPAAWAHGAEAEDAWDDDHAADDDVQAADGRLMSQFGGSGRKSRRSRHRWILTLICVVIVLAAALGLGMGTRFLSVWWGKRYGNYAGDGYGSVRIQVMVGENATHLGPQLVTAGVIEAAGPFISVANASAKADTLQPGSYKMHYHMNAAKAWALLLSPSGRLSTGVTLPEGLRASQIVAKLSQKTGISVSKFEQALKDPAALGLPSYAKGNPEGYLYPATYSFAPGETATQILKTMVGQFNQEARSVNLVQAAARVNLTPAQVIVIASLVEAEAGPVTDYGKVSRVIDNRLNGHMKLQFDSTVFYGLGTYGTRATTADLKSNSPYNTYRYFGLPPGAIDNPGDLAIKAALNPPHGGWLYFITVNLRTGLTKFTSSYTQFLQWEQQANNG